VDGFLDGCARLMELWLRNSVREIVALAFSGCLQLLGLFVPASIETFAANAFSGREQSVGFAAGQLFGLSCNPVLGHDFPRGALHSRPRRQSRLLPADRQSHAYR
jgi:hypothetical protein